MFNSYSFKRIEFYSNPPLPEAPHVVPDERPDGVICNKVVYQPKSNRSIFDGIHYSAEVMSLRAKLNLGVTLTKVSNVNLDNDPAIVQRNMLKVEQDIENRLNELSAAPVES